MLEVAVLYGCDLSQVFTPIILRLYQPHSLCEKGATRAAAKAALYVFLLTPLPERRGSRAFLLPPLREGRPAVEGFMHYNRIISIHAPTRGTTAIFTKPQVDLYDKLLKNSHFLYTPAFI